MFNERRAANREEVNRFEKQKASDRSNNEPPRRREHIERSRESYHSRDHRDYGRSDRNRDSRDRPRGPRDNRDRPRDNRDRPRDNRDRPRDRDRDYHSGGSRYDNRNRDDRDRNSNNNNRYSGFNRHNSYRSTREEVPSFETMKPTNSFWDKPPKDYEGASAAMAKSSGLFPIPGSTAKNLDSQEVQRILNKKKTIRAISVAQKELTPAKSRNSTRLIISGVDFDKVTPQQIQKYFENFIVSSVIPNVEYEDHTLHTYLTSDNKKLIVETSKSVVATVLNGFSDLPIPELDVSLKIERPHEYIVFDDEHQSTSQDEIADEIIETPNLYGLKNIPFGTLREDLIDLLSKYGDLESLAVILDKVTYDSKGLAFFEFKKLNVSPEEAISALSEKTIDSNSLICYKACENSDNGYLQKLNVTADTLAEVTDNKTGSITRHDVTRVIQLLNCLDLSDLLSEAKYKDIYSSFETECSRFGSIVELRIPRPELGFKEHIDEVKPEFGKVFVKFESASQATKCLHGLCGRLFTNRIVIGAYFDEYDFDTELL